VILLQMLRPERLRFRRLRQLPTAVCAGYCLHCHTPPTFARAICSGTKPERPGPPWSAALERRDRLEPKLRCGRSPPPPRNGLTLPHGRTYEGTSVSEQPVGSRATIKLLCLSGRRPGFPPAGGRSSCGRWPLSPAAGRSSFRVSPRSGPLPSRACGTHRPGTHTFPTEKNRPEAGLPAAGGRSSLHAHRKALQVAPQRPRPSSWAPSPFRGRSDPHAIYSVCSAVLLLRFV